ncbi:iron-containing redox enzyme family protein [Streptacidiphilus griseoplanus]|uniref:iron-containing redox enzyme family protein n=1 Tax=Peterkaempfera griseoplana TaxID=66896 RepID=UPI0006E2DBF3|nr:iron-containing redox enzyme family protein [Peterkaempfera griseoplana]
MTASPSSGLPPDTIDPLPPTRPGRFEFSPGAAPQAAALLALPAADRYRRLLADQESEPALLAALRTVDAFLAGAPQPPRPGTAAAAPPTADGIAAEVLAVREELSATLGELAAAPAGTRTAVLRQRAPVALLGGCWLDTLSQPATQPTTVVNRLFTHHFRLKGEGEPQRSAEQRRRRALEDLGVLLPPLNSEAFLRETQARPLTALHGSFYLALSRFPASFLPEVAGVHYAFHALGVDDLLLGTPPVLDEPLLRGALADCLAALVGEGGGAAGRLHTAVRLCLALEREHVALLAGLADRRRRLTLDQRVGRILGRHAPYAGEQHRRVRLGGRPLSEAMESCAADPGTLVALLKGSPQLRRRPDGGYPFLDAIAFGGPMFGIFDREEAATLRQWAETADRGTGPAVTETAGPATDEAAADEAATDEPAESAAAADRWSAALTAHRAAGEVLADPGTPGDRALLRRLVDIEHFPGTLPLARQRALETLDAAEILFEHGARGRCTDAEWFDYTPERLIERVERIYWDKLVGSCRPVARMPDREQVVAGRRRAALSHLVDGAWAYRTGNAGRFDRPADGMLFAIYADEMGRGDPRKNHLTLIRQVLADMGIGLPHIREEAFVEQVELPDDSYPFAIHQLCLALFPDTLYNEILGFNLGAEMFGLGELGLQQIEKLRHHGFDACYEQAHLSIDNMSAGHARQAADLVVAHLDTVRRTSGAAAVQQEWRRVWRGYASFALFAEHRLVRVLTARTQGSPR